MSGKDKDKEAVPPKNLRSLSQNQKDSPSAKKGADKGSEKGTEKPAKDPKDPKQPPITDYQVEHTEKHSEAGVLNEIRKFNEDMKVLFKEMDQKMDDRFKSIDEKFSKLFKGLQKEVDQLKEEMTESKTKVENTNKKVSEIEKSLEFQSEQLKDVENKQEKKLKKSEEALDKKIAELDSKLMLLERHDRKYNLLFYGITEEDEEDPIERLQRLFVDDLKIDMTIVNRMQFVHCHRVPSRGKGPKPIILRFLSYQDRELVLSNAKLLAGSKRRILVDLPNSMKIERNRLAKEAYYIRKKELLQTRIKDKGLDVYLEVRKKSTDKWVKREV